MPVDVDAESMHHLLTGKFHDDDLQKTEKESGQCNSKQDTSGDHGSGDVLLQLDLAQGEAVLVSTGSLAAFAESVDYDIQGVSGCRRMVFGGEGLFMTRLSGPGRVLLQTLKRTTPGAKESQ